MVQCVAIACDRLASHFGQTGSIADLYRHYGVNAIAYAARLIGEILRMEEELKSGPLNPRFDPPWTTTQVTQIEGGTAGNIVPVPCWFGWETRALPGFGVRIAPLEVSVQQGFVPADVDRVATDRRFLGCWIEPES